MIATMSKRSWSSIEYCVVSASEDEEIIIAVGILKLTPLSLQPVYISLVVDSMGSVNDAMCLHPTRPNADHVL